MLVRRQTPRSWPAIPCCFKNRNLKTIRDLRESHLVMLQEVYVTVSAWLKSRHKNKYYMYFHYMPSVFQLHLHVNSNTQHINWDRAHLMSTVTANLRQDSQYYAKALILTKMCKTIRSANAHIKLKTKLPSVWIHFNQSDMCLNTPHLQSTRSTRGKLLTSCLIRWSLSSERAVI